MLRRRERSIFTTCPVQPAASITALNASLPTSLQAACRTDAPINLKEIKEHDDVVDLGQRISALATRGSEALRALSVRPCSPGGLAALPTIHCTAHSGPKPRATCQPRLEIVLYRVLDLCLPCLHLSHYLLPRNIPVASFDGFQMRPHFQP